LNTSRQTRAYQHFRHPRGFLAIRNGKEDYNSICI
jgi:hypothetical protein